MRSLLKFTGLLAAIAVLGIGGLFLSGNAQAVLVRMLQPGHDFDPSRLVPPPNYVEATYWAALPETEDLADIVPAGIAARTGQPAAQVFFIHPTGYISRDEWNSPMDPQSRTEENTQWQLANQASVFNSCCDIWAPRYREANAYVYMTDDKETMRQALGVAYQDVEQAFDEFLDRRDPTLPFIIASHSQGTHHATSLLKNRIGGTALRNEMVAAYIIGGRTRVSDIDEMADVEVCTSAEDLHCVVHWRTYGEGGRTEGWVDDDDSPLVCINPLSWTDNSERVGGQGLLGAVESSGTVQFSLWGKDQASGVTFDPQPAPIPGLTWAECRDGTLIVADLSDSPMTPMLGAGKRSKNYHSIDYPLFHMNIRENAIRRVAAWHTANPAGVEAQDSAMAP